MLKMRGILDVAVYTGADCVRAGREASSEGSMLGIEIRLSTDTNRRKA